MGAARTLPVIVNRSGGAAARLSADLVPTIEQAFAAAGVEAQVRAVDGGAVADAAEQAARDHPRIVVAGGDGTLGGVADRLKGRDVELAILPLGTLNHLARDLGIPADLAEAAALGVSGTARGIDVGEVNGRAFVNNASVGLYSLMVRERTAEQKRLHVPKWLATIPAAWHALSRLPHHRLHLHFGGGDRRVSTPLLFVGNNDYSLEGGHVGQRAALDDGRLSIFAVARRSRAGLLWFAARTLVGRAHAGQDFVALGNCPALTVETHGPDVELAIDGEITRLATPLRFSVAPGALKVVAPPSPRSP